MIWEILGIAPTKDIKTIKQAYAKLAKQFNPEEHPEEFKRIHSAYKAACAFARSSQKKPLPVERPMPREAEKKKPAFDFGSIGSLDDFTIIVFTQEDVFEIIKEWIADPIKKNNHHSWRMLLSMPDVEEMLFDINFRKKAQMIFKGVLLSPEAASAIASGFGRGSKAVHYAKDDKSPDSLSTDKLGKFPTGNGSMQRWQVLISDGTGKPVKTKPTLPGYARPSDRIKITDIIICIIIGAVLILWVGLRLTRRDDSGLYENDTYTAQVSETFKIGDREFYRDENGRLKEYNGQG
ncbi:MAG: DnaJ domain-containing protein [Oscillospiraceae bacterium]|nr:DnaJ domain-containing protein [Oscillospiraceae bacterium]